MKYTDESKNTVQVEGRSIPRNHRLWFELEIDKAEEAGEIEPHKTAGETIYDQIAEIEAEVKSKVTDRLVREAKLGRSHHSGATSDEYLLSIYQEADDKIAELRKKLQ